MCACTAPCFCFPSVTSSTTITLCDPSFRDEESLEMRLILSKVIQLVMSAWVPCQLGPNVLSIPADYKEIFATLGVLLQNLVICPSLNPL